MGFVLNKRTDELDESGDGCMCMLWLFNLVWTPRPGLIHVLPQGRSVYALEARGGEFYS